MQEQLPQLLLKEEMLEQLLLDPTALVPLSDGSGSTSQALLRGCGSLANGCTAFIGGKRKRKSKRKKSRRKKRKTRRKSRKRRRKRKSKRGGGCNGRAPNKLII